ncbi:MAG TPA: hypothetical protein VH988_27845 [Thermoanaerobaculia bacterium]|jgi:hypothetical protein|nr:hypothetical protein [Thermoanaerobaculia bacterium]
MKALRWLAIWLLLTGTYLAGWVVAGWLARGGVALDTGSLACLVAVPLAQTAALRGLAAFRRMFRDARDTAQER